MKARDTGSLLYELVIGVGVPVQVTTNFNKRDGFCNGAYGVVKKMDEERKIIWVEFVESGRVGVAARSAVKNVFIDEVGSGWTPVYQVCAEFQVFSRQDVRVNRRQFPLEPATARTIHKSQGATITVPYVVDLGGKTDVGLAYVALSRAKEFEQLCVKNFDASKVVVSTKVLAEMARLELPENRVIIDGHERTNPMDIRVTYLNVGFQLVAQGDRMSNIPITNMHDVVGCKHIMASDIFFLAETCGTALLFKVPTHTMRAFSQGRGMVMFAKVGLDVIVDSVSENLGLHVVNITVRTLGGDLKICALYRNASFNNLNLLPDVVDLQNTTLILGDFNLEFWRAPQTFRTYMAQAGLKYIDFGMTTDRRTCIDMAFAKTGFKHHTFETYFSYHKAISVDCPTPMVQEDDCGTECELI
jgi:hypothetical protein